MGYLYIYYLDFGVKLNIFSTYEKMFNFTPKSKTKEVIYVLQ